MHVRLLIGLLLASFCIVSHAQNEEFSLNLKDVDIHILIETVADATGKNFIVDPRVTGNISVITSTPMKSSQVYEVFLSILKVHGYSAVPNGNIIKIIPNLDAKQDGDQNELRFGSRNGDEQLTRIVQVNHINATAVVQTLMPLVPPHAFMATVTDSNSIIISDTASNVNRLALMIKQIDKSDAQKIEIINLKYAIAADLIQPLNALVASTNNGKSSASMLPLVADDRSNSIIIGGAPEIRLQLKALIAELDTPLQGKNGNTEVIYLHYAVAKSLVETLTGVSAKKSESTPQVVTPSSTEKDFDIRADEATNALIVTAPAEQMRSIKSVIQQLDIRRAQVHIEAIIVEVNYDKEQQVGVEWHTKPVRTTGVQADSIVNLASLFETTGKTLSLGYMVGGELRALMDAFASDQNVNVLSTPSLVTLDNEEANMIVGQNIPIVSGSFAPTVGVGSAVSTYTRQDVGVKLKVTPQINEGNVIKLKVKQEVSSVDATSAGSLSGPTINKREIDTSVLVDDGKILVLGGLIGDDVQVTVTKVPLLGDLPYVGHLFQSNNTSNKKTNLMVFLRPVIMRDPEKASLLSNDRYNDLRNMQKHSGKRGLFLMPSERESVLPELKPEVPSPILTAPANQ